MKILFTVLALSLSLFADAIDDLKPGEWLEIPNSKLYDVRAPQDSFASALCGGIEGIAGIINDWCSGSFDTKRNRLMIGPGGGHNGYSGNEVYAFDINDLKWHRITDPQPLISCTSERPNPDSFPGAAHTYDALEYMPPPFDRLLVVDQWYHPHFYYTLDLNTLVWKVHKSLPGVAQTGDISVYDTLTKRFFYGSGQSAKMVEWDPILDTTYHRFSGNFYYQNMDNDPKRNLLVAVGHSAGTKAIPITAYPGAMNNRVIYPVGDIALEAQDNPGLDYDDVSDKMVGWSGRQKVSKFDVYTLDIDQNRWTRHIPGASNTVTPGDENQWGTWGRWKYVPSKNVFIVYNDVRQNVFFFRFTSWRDTIAIDSINTFSQNATIEQYLSVPLTVKAFRKDGLSDTISNSCTFISLDTNKAVMNGFMLTARDTGKVGIAVRKSTAKSIALDTFYITISSSTAMADSVRITPKQIVLMNGETYQFKATGYYYFQGQQFSKDISIEAAWSVEPAGLLKISNGQVFTLATGNATVISIIDGKSDTAHVKISVKPEIIVRINFTPSTTPFAYGWQIDNGIAYNSIKGKGWKNTLIASTFRDDRSGGPLLGTFVNTNRQRCTYQIDVPDGSYIIRVAVGDNAYGDFDTVSFGNENLAVAIGSKNVIATDTVIVTGGSGLPLLVNGKINYLVLISNQGINMDSVAWDKAPFYQPDTVAHIGDTTVLSTSYNDFNYKRKTGNLRMRAWPNPFNPTIHFSIAGATTNDSRIEIFDISGRCVKRMNISAKNLISGSINWNAHQFESGFYCVRVTSGAHSVTRQVVLVK